MRALHRLAFCALVLSLFERPARGQVPQISVTFPGRADSIFRATSGIFRERHYSIVRSDSTAKALEALTADTPPVRVRVSHQPAGDSTLITMSAEGGEVAGLRVLIELADALRPRPSGPRRSAPEGATWPTDPKGRVGFLVLTRPGARWLKMKAGDTIPEIRPADLPQTYRRQWEDEINDVGFDASCARFFRGATRYIVRFNFCGAPTPDGDRFDVYEDDGGIYGVTIGPTVATYIQAMCPAARSPWPALSPSKLCPPPF